MYNEHEKWQLSDKNGQIRPFYAGKRVLLTGCTGFFGTGILEKLLRTCLEIDKIYLMIRPKKNMTAEERVKKYFQDNVFDVLRQTNPNFMDKIVPFHGDLEKVHLGISPEDRQHLKQNVDIIIHNAAQVNFTAKVSTILRINVLGTKYMLELAAECSRLKTFVYVSTGYSHSYNKEIEEKFYPSPGDLKMAEDMIRADEGVPCGINDGVVREMLGKCTNLYTFSKCIAESLVEDFSKKASIPCAVFRPTMVIASYKEPVPGWIGNQNGPALVLMAMNMGLIHVLPMSESAIMDLIPVDMTVNALLASVWDLIVHKKLQGPQVYNYGSSYWKPFNTRSYRTTWFKANEAHALYKTVWYPFVICVGNFYVFMLLHLLFHLIPAALYDSVSFTLGRKMRAFSICMKLTKFIKSINYFINNNWVVKVDNTHDMLIRMNVVDHEEFPFDLGRMDYRKCMFRYAASFKTNLLKESLDTLPAAQRKYRRLRTAHYVLSTLFIFLIMFLFYRLMCNVCC